MISVNKLFSNSLNWLFFGFLLLGESHDKKLGLECRNCHRSFRNRRQILKHICLREEEEEEDEEQNGEEWNEPAKGNINMRQRGIQRTEVWAAWASLGIIHTPVLTTRCWWESGRISLTYIYCTWQFKGFLLIDSFSGSICGGTGVEGYGSLDPAAANPNKMQQNSARPGPVREKGKFKIRAWFLQIKSYQERHLIAALKIAPECDLWKQSLGWIGLYII